MNTILRQAIDSNELILYFSGQKNYSVPCPYADMPTDPHWILDSIEQYFVDDDLIRKKIIKVIIQLSESIDYCWLVPYYIVGILRIETKWNKHFLDKETIIKIRNELNNNKSYLKNNRKWIGNDFEDGLWGDVIRMSNNIKEKYGVSLLII